MDTVDKFVQCINRGDTQGPFVLASDDCMVRFEDMTEMPWVAYIKASEEILASFPDFYFTVSKKVVSGNKISLVKCVVGGTHTGVPFGLSNTPSFPKIKSTGIVVRNDPETFEFTVEGGKIAAFRIIACGEKTGPHGFCNQVAGLVF